MYYSSTDLDSSQLDLDSDFEVPSLTTFQVRFQVTIHQYVNNVRLPVTVDQSSNQNEVDPSINNSNDSITFAVSVANKCVGHWHGCSPYFFVGLQLQVRG